MHAFVVCVRVCVRVCVLGVGVYVCVLGVGVYVVCVFRFAQQFLSGSVQDFTFISKLFPNLKTIFPDQVAAQIHTQFNIQV